MTGKKTLFNIFIALVVAAALFFVYRWFFQPEASDQTLELVSGGFLDENYEPAADEFLQILLSLQQIDLTTELFDSAVFQSVVDFSRPLPSRTSGRANPFAPIGVGGSLPETAVDTGVESGSAASEAPAASNGEDRGALLEGLLPSP